MAPLESIIMAHQSKAIIFLSRAFGITLYSLHIQKFIFSSHYLKAILFLIYSITCIPFLLSCLWQKHHIIICIFISSNSILHYTKFCISFIIGCDVQFQHYFHHFFKVGQAIVCNFFTFSSAN